MKPPIRSASAAMVLVLLLGACALPDPQPTPSVEQPLSMADDRHVMVTFHPAPEAVWASSTSELAANLGLLPVVGWRLASIRAYCVIYRLPAGRTIDSVLPRLNAHPRVDVAQRVQTFHLLGRAYNDPYHHLQHGLGALGVEQAHRWATGRGVQVALIDTGVDIDHPDLRGRILRAASFVGTADPGFTRDLHGTAVAGVIAATANNQEGIVGVAPEAGLLALKACWHPRGDPMEGVCDTYTLAQALDFALEAGAQVLNLSLTGPEDPLLTRLLQAALSRGTPVVTAASPDRGTTHFPATVEGVLAVASAPAGTRGLTVTPGEILTAPGIDVLTTVPRRGYDFLSGSSLAAAHATGIVALLLEQDADLTPEQISALLRETSRPLGPDEANPHGALLHVDACAALASLVGEAAAC